MPMHPYSNDMRRNPYAAKDAETGAVINWWPTTASACKAARNEARKTGRHLYVVDDRTGVVIGHYGQKEKSNA